MLMLKGSHLKKSLKKRAEYIIGSSGHISLVFPAKTIISNLQSSNSDIMVSTGLDYESPLRKKNIGIFLSIPIIFQME